MYKRAYYKFKDERELIKRELLILSHISFVINVYDVFSKFPPSNLMLKVARYELKA